MVLVAQRAVSLVPLRHLCFSFLRGRPPSCCPPANTTIKWQKIEKAEAVCARGRERYLSTNTYCHAGHRFTPTTAVSRYITERSRVSKRWIREMYAVRETYARKPASRRVIASRTYLCSSCGGRQTATFRRPFLCFFSLQAAPAPSKDGWASSIGGPAALVGPSTTWDSASDAGE